MSALQGLTEQEATKRRQQGDGNDFELKTSRTYGQIIKKNIFNLVNSILFAIGGMLILLGRPTDALSSAGLILLNALIGTAQEIRAKRKLDSIALLIRPKVVVIRDGAEKEIDPSQLVRGDLLVAYPGDQLVADGVVVNGRLEADESMLTGESDAVSKKEGDELLSSSYCISGKAIYEAQKVGEESFANRLTATAREFQPFKTPLQMQVDKIIGMLAVLAVFFGYLLFLSAQIYELPFVRVMQLLAVITGLIPVGIFTMTVVSYGLGAVRLISEGALTQESNAIESLSNVDILCTDKTGTLTANRILFNELHPVGIEGARVGKMLGSFVHGASVTNKTSEAVANAFSGDERSPTDEVPFSSARKWSAVAFDDGVYVMGAMAMLRPYLTITPAMEMQAQEWADRGLRVLLFAHNPDVMTLHDGEEVVLPDLRPLALLSFSDELRAGVEETIASFKAAGVQLKVISGDDPATVAALAKQAGLGDDLQLISGIELAKMDDAQFAQAANEATVFGRITPDQKERLVDALKSAGHYVAMIGDGVNDVLPLKKADLGVAMESGSAAARGVADIILLKDNFGALAPAFLAGQSIVNGMRGIIRLFMARTLSVALLMMAAGIIGIAMPFLPNNNAAYAAFTVGIPTMFLALWARPGKPTDEEKGLSSVFAFAFPAAFLNMAFGILILAAGYYIVLNGLAEYTLSPEQLANLESVAGFAATTQEAAKVVTAGYVGRTALTTFTIFTGIILILFAQPIHRFFAVAGDVVDDIKPTLLAGAMGLLFIGAMLWERTRSYFELVLLRPSDYVIIAVMVIIWTFAVRYVLKIRLHQRVFGK